MTSSHDTSVSIITGDTFQLVPPARSTVQTGLESTNVFVRNNPCKDGGWKRYFPVTFWLPKYKIREYLCSDMIAGLTAAIMLIPQGMAYAMIAELSPINGLYSSMFGPLIYSVFGTSGQLSVAPVAIVSLMTAESWEGQIRLDHSDPQFEDTAHALASCLALQVGIIQLCLGFFKAGVLANMLSHSVILGFTGAAALLIGMSQIKYAFKITIERGDFIDMLIDFVTDIKNAHWQTFLLALGCMIVLLALKTWKQHPQWPGGKHAKFIPGALIVVIFGVLLSWGINDPDLFAIIGDIDRGLPTAFNFFNLVSFSDFLTMFPTALIISIIAFIESYAVGNKYAQSKGYRLDASQELVALGACNIVGSWFRIFPITGGLSRTAVADAAGAITPISSAVAGLFMLVALAAFVQLFKWLPKAVLGAIVLVAVVNLFDYKGMAHLWKVKRKDFYVMLVTFFVTLIFGVEIGVGTGVIASVLIFVQRASNPHYAILGQLPDNPTVFKNVKNYPNAKRRPDMIILRWDASLFFANIATFTSRIKRHVAQFKYDHPSTTAYALLLPFSGINDIDSSAAEELHSFLAELRGKDPNSTVIITGLKKPVRLVMEAAGVMEVVGSDRVFFDIVSAMEWWDTEQRNRSIEVDIVGATPELTGNAVEEEQQEKGLLSSTVAHSPPQEKLPQEQVVEVELQQS